jgi:hypothetical protein
LFCCGQGRKGVRVRQVSDVDLEVRQKVALQVLQGLDED